MQGTGSEDGTEAKNISQEEYSAGNQLFAEVRTPCIFILAN